MKDIRTLLRLKARINRMSIKESLDNLPSGICIARKNGTLALCNRQMQRLFQQLAGMDLQHISELERAIIQPGHGVLVLDADTHTLRFPEGTVWQFTESVITDERGNWYTQAVALDITELTDRRSELERENGVLLTANARARRLYHELDDIVREEERLAIKMRVHDDIGIRLLSARKALETEATLEELHRCGQDWSALAGFFSTSEAQGRRDDEMQEHVPLFERMEELICSAAGIGINITMEGSLPEDETIAYLILTAVRVCATNAVQHAHADQMLVRISGGADSGAITVAIMNNGGTPAQEIIEGGGLSSLRGRIEKAGGVMNIKSLPEFRLTLTLPKERSNP